MKIVMSSVDPNLIRCNQVGDWSYTPETILASVAGGKFSSESEFAILIHEAVEAFLCRENGITDEQVCEFDQMFEKERAEGKHRDDEENGDDPRAPYRNEHVAATFVERAVCSALEIAWGVHGKEVEQAHES